MGGSRVLLIDGDLRKGALHELMGLQRKPGLTELIRQPTGQLAKFTQTNSLPNLTFLSRGETVNSSNELFLNPAFDQLLAQVRQQYDYILIDSSPIFATDDAATLAPKADGVILVLRNEYSSARVVNDALDLLSQRQARILGVVFNRANAESRSYHYYKYADYHAEEEVEPSGKQKAKN